MSTTLAQNPLRTSLSMIHDHEVEPTASDVSEYKPLGYLYSTWGPQELTDEQADMGFYDPDAQVWVAPDGITAGIMTKTRTTCHGTVCDNVTDDACA